MSKNFDGIKTQRFGCEVECAGLTRNISRQMKEFHRFLNDEIPEEKAERLKETVGRLTSAVGNTYV